MKKTLNQLKASRRNLSLMLLAGMISNLKHIKHFVRDTEVAIRIDTLLAAIERLQSSIILACSTHDYYAKASISGNDKRDYYEIVARYINTSYYLNNFMSRIRIILNEATVKDGIYTIKFEFGNNSKIFKYKHE